MKYRNGKIQIKHGIIKDFIKFLGNIEKIREIERIIPGKISRQQKGTSKIFITFSYYTKAGLKYNLKKGGTAQELFITCKKENQAKVNEQIKTKI